MQRMMTTGACIVGLLLLMMTMMTMMISCTPVQGQAPPTTTSRYAPDIDALLLEHGYQRNIIDIRGVRGLRASQTSYTTSIWSRDLDYAISGYSLVLDDMSVFRGSIELFLTRTDEAGVVPEAIHSNWPEELDYENRQSWDSMPNIIHAVYVYVAKTGDRDFYRTHRDTLQRVGTWIASLDQDGNGLPDNDIFPYGYYDSVTNGVMHTYALAKFYTAFRELAELERAIGQDGSVWEGRAAKLREGFHRPFNEGGYWPDDQAWPIAWRKADGRVVRVLETFGVFAALQSGLITPQDGAHYQDLVRVLDTHFSDLTGGPSPMKLTLGGYEPEIRREVDPPVPLWMLDASAPWIVGLAAPGYARASSPDHARSLMQSYIEMARMTDPPVLEFAAAADARYGPGNSGDGGRTWDSAAWFLALYGGHYGLTMTPAALIVAPHPYEYRLGDGVQHIRYQGSTLQLDMDAEKMTYRIQADRQTPVILRPIGGAEDLRLDGGEPVAEQEIVLEPGRVYVVTSGEQAPQPAPEYDAPPFDGFFAVASLYDVWSRTDLPIQRGVAGSQDRSWMWGTQPLTSGMQEPYAEGEEGTRLVQYFDKSRMEVNHPDAPRDQWYVTNGRLVAEMIEGKIQVGDQAFIDHEPAEQAVAGDPSRDNPQAPTYRSFRPVAYPTNPEPAPDRRGEVVTTVLTRDGQTREDPSLATYQVTLANYNDQTGHNIPALFTSFFAQRGVVFENGTFGEGAVMDWMFVLGLPISEPYWARVRVGGVEKDVLMQAFERRILTYTPDNDPSWRVEMGNVGQHYLRWRY
jgi:hypothetical protein